MTFHFETDIVLKQGFDIEAANPKEAMKKIEKYVYEEADLNEIEVSCISFDLTDPSFRAYLAESGRKYVERYKKMKQEEARNKGEGTKAKEGQ